MYNFGLVTHNPENLLNKYLCNKFTKKAKILQIKDKQIEEIACLNLKQFQKNPMVTDTKKHKNGLFSAMNKKVTA